MNTDISKGKSFISAYEVCDSIIKNAPPAEKTKSCRPLTEKLKKSLIYTEKAYKNAQSKENAGAELSDSFLWLTDNYSFIDEEFTFALKLLPRKKSLFLKNDTPLIFHIAYDLCVLCDGAFTEEYADACVICCDKAVEKGFGYYDYSSYPLLVKCALLCYIGEAVREMCRDGGYIKDSEAGQRLISALKSLKALCVHSYSEAYSLCRLEKILSCDPSGAYPYMDEASKAELRKKLHARALKTGVSDCEYAERLLEKAKNATTDKEKYIGYKISDDSLSKSIYFPALLGFSVICTLLFLCKIPPVFSILVFFPVYDGVKTTLDFIISKLCKNSGTIPSLALSEIPDNAKTLCVITALLRGEEYDSELFSRLERIYCANGGKNIRFGILCDLGDADSATKSDDRKTVDYAKGRIDSLNSKYGNNFIFFVRSRSYSKSERAFMAYERKRGAVIELVKLIKGEKTQFDTYTESLVQNSDFISDVRYVITLDADTNLGLDSARLLVSKMLHPSNRPQIDKQTHMVTCGYGIMQPRISTDLEGASATPFSRLMCGSGGTDIYSGAAFDLYQSVFGEGIFCGKGIFDTDAFYETVVKSDFFPEDKILSHDILEGEKLKTALLCDIELTDGFPKSELSYLKRKHRWIRGDIQNLSYLGSHIRYENKKIKNPLSALSKYKLLDNARRAVTPIFSLALIITAFFRADIAIDLLACALIPYTVPFILDAINLMSGSALSRAARKFYSKGVTVSIWQSFLRMLFFEAMLAKDALMSLSATVTSLYRMLISKKKLLEWVTAAQSDSGKNSVSLYISKHTVSAILGGFLFILSPGGAVRFCGLAFFIMPIIGYMTSKDLKQRKGVSSPDKKMLTAYAADIWSFFEKNVTDTENFLPPDNVQFSPYEKTAHRTSPTNIGLYLTALLCARDFGFIDSDTLYSKIRATLDTIERLEKWNGHLYNWYDTTSCEVLNPKYISSVDSGNFVACLITVKNGLADYACEKPENVELIARIARLIENTDFLPLYNKNRELFSVGVTVSGNRHTADTGCYDFLMSEARILSYIATARRTVPKEHWKRLSRPLVTSHGYIGLSSWSGTAFEYFMPNLFMPVRKNSLFYEAMRFAYKAQIRRRAENVWGISESGFFAFDCDLNYQYKAFGVPMLAKKSGTGSELVISPYSSFLSMCVSPDGALLNLAELQKLGIYGKYGFYEAVDFTRSRVKNSFACVKSYMSHHLGMSIAALANAALDGAISKRFMADSKMNCAAELLEEKIPVNAIIKKLKHQSNFRIHAEKPRPQERKISSDFSFAFPKAACISDGKISVCASDCGHIRLAKNGTLLCGYGKERFPAELPESLYCYVRLDGRIYGMTPLATKVFPDSRYSFSYSDCSLSHRLSCDKGELEISYTVSSRRRSLIRIRLNGSFDAKNADFRFMFFPRLSSEASHSSHPSFSDLFMEAVYDKQEKILYYKRRKRSCSEEEMILAVALSDKNAPFVFETRKDFKRHRLFYADPHVLFENPKETDGACINPICIIGSELKTKSSELFIVMTHSISDAKEAICGARNDSFEQAEKTLAETASQFTLSSGISSVSADGTVRELLSDIMFGDGDLRRKSAVADFAFSQNAHELSINSLWKHGISGDEPIVLINTGGFFIPSPLEKRIRAFRLLTMKNIRCDLVIAYREQDKYSRKTEKKLKELISSCGAENYIGRRAGIHLVEKSGNGDMQALLNVACSYTDIFSDDAKKPSASKCSETIFPITKGKAVDSGSHGFAVIGGRFSGESFILEKDNDIRLPWAHVISGENISSVVTQNSLGYTFYRNASEQRITPIQKSGLSEYDGEKLYLRENGMLFDLAFCAGCVKYSCGKAEYSGKVSGISYTITVFCDSKLPVKAMTLKINGNVRSDSEIIFRADPCMGRNRTSCISKAVSENTVMFKNPLSDDFGEYDGFISVFADDKCFCRCPASLYSDNDGAICENAVAVGCKLSQECEICFVIGAAKQGSGIYEKTKESFGSEVYARLEKSESFCNSIMPKISLKSTLSGDTSKSIEKMFNVFLPYSTAISRMLSRSGYYQSGGAYGFRDQLQDAVAIMYADRKRAFTHICRAAAHQFPQGDVLHWWHNCGEKGVRTRCSDDYLWLVYAVCEYISFTGDGRILDTNIYYIDGEILPDGVQEKYIKACVSELRESIYKHCIRALDRACSLTGAHGLCLIGSCDWCDGYSLVGKDGKGESVWLSMFLSMLLERFSVVCEHMKDSEISAKYKSFSETLKQAIIAHGYDKENGYFIRGYYDDGTAFGSEKCDEGKIDLLPQSFAPLAGLPEEMCKSALKKASEYLFDEKNGLMKLVYPPFDKTEKEPGYIKGYLPGVRENGGQYTHGALFSALGFSVFAGQIYKKDADTAKEFSDIAGKILLYSNPAFRSSYDAPPDIREAFMTEPYAVAADIYSNKDHPARGGWTHYTGACGWMWRLLLSEFLGLEFKNTEKDDRYIFIDPASPTLLSHLLSGVTVDINLCGFDLEIIYINDGKKQITADGKVISGNRIYDKFKKVQIHF